MEKLKNIQLSTEVIIVDDFKNNPELSGDLSAETTGLPEICRVLNTLKNILRGTACIAFIGMTVNAHSATAVDSAKLVNLVGNNVVVTNVTGLDTLAEKTMITQESVFDIVDPAYTNSIAWRVAHGQGGAGPDLENDPVWLEWRHRAWTELAAGAVVSNKTEGLAIGRNAYVGSKNFGTAIGSGAKAYGDMSFAIGTGSPIARGDRSVAIGKTPIANGDDSTAIGYYATADGHASAAFGGNSHAKGMRALATGWAATADGLNATAVGNGAIVTTNTVGCGAFGSGAEITANTTNAYQIGFGKNTESNTLKFMDKRVATWEDVTNIIRELIR